MVTLAKRVADPNHYSALGTFKWTQLEVIERLIYDTYSRNPAGTTRLLMVSCYSF